MLTAAQPFVQSPRMPQTDVTGQILHALMLRVSAVVGETARIAGSWKRMKVGALPNHPIHQACCKSKIAHVHLFFHVDGDRYTFCTYYTKQHVAVRVSVLFAQCTRYHSIFAAWVRLVLDMPSASVTRTHATVIVGCIVCVSHMSTYQFQSCEHIIHTDINRHCANQADLALKAILLAKLAKNRNC